MTERVTILVGTMTGTAEMVADEVKTVLGGKGFAAEVRLFDGLGAEIFAGGGLFLVCSSTYGQGDVPDNARDFVAAVTAARPDLSAVRYGVIALGDRTYAQTFCHGGLALDRLLAELGATRLGAALTHDASSGDLAEDVAVDWAADWADLVTARRAAA